MLLSLQASCALVGYDPIAVSHDAGGGPTAPQVETPAQDAGEPVAVDLDAGDIEALSDGGVSTDAGPTASCAGATALGVCWYLANPAASCASTCTEHGGLNERAPSLIGTSSQGGRLSNCRRVLSALGVMQPPQRAVREDNYGLGCHLWSNGEAFWLDDPSPRYSAFSPGPYTARVSCGCVR